MTLNPADQAFYEWYHEHGKSSIAIESQREIFTAGWNAKPYEIVEA